MGLLFWLTYQFVEPPPPKTVHIAAGREGSAYYHFAEKYKAALKKSGIELVIHSSAGTLNSLELLHQNKVQLALVQSGVSKASPLKFAAPPVTLAALSYEPVWVFHPKAMEINYLFELKGKRLIIGEEGSGTQALARRLLSHNGVNADNSTLINMPDRDAVTALENNQADAIFLVSALQSKLVQELLHKQGVKLLSFRRAATYDAAYPHLNKLTLSEGLVNLAENVPKSPKDLIATTAILIAEPNLNDLLVRLLLREAKAIHANQFNYDSDTAFPQGCCSDIPFKAEAKRYLDKGDSWTEGLLPFWLASLVDRLFIMLLPILTIIPLIFKVLPILYRYQIRSRIYRWYGQLIDLDVRLQALITKGADENLATIETALYEIELKANEATNVPLSYMSEFYHLRAHIQLVIKRLENYKLTLRTKGE